MNTYQRAIQIYQVLISAAHHRQLLTYEIVGNRIGLPSRSLGRHLVHIHRICERRGLPRLTCLAINKQTGQPSHGYTDLIATTDAQLHRDREAVYARNWFRDPPLSVEDLQD